jgi:tetratricopeptide (TPR) repeat protein
MNFLRAAFVLVLATFAFASVVPGGGFVFDDHVLIERNADLKRADVWRNAFSRDYYATSDRPGVSGYYRPIAVLFNAFDVQVSGPGARGAHLTNIVLHAAASLSVPWALMAFGIPAAAAWGTALVFAAHPVHAESVAFVSGRVDVLAALFVMLALAMGASKRSLAWFGVGAATLLAFLSKEIAIVLPVLFFILWWPQRRAGIPKTAVIAVAAAGLVTLLLRHHALGGLLPATASATRPDGPAWLPVRTLLFAVESLFAPVRLVSMEPDPSRLDAVRLGMGIAAAAAIWAAAFVFAEAHRAALRRCALAGGAALLPVLNLLPQETQLSERFLYLPSVFLLAPAGVLVVQAWSAGRLPRWLGTVACGLAIAALLWISQWRAVVWRTDLSLWQQAVREEPQRAAFWDRLGLTFTERSQWQQAERALRRAIDLDPNLFNGWHNLGVLFGATRRPDEAASAYRRALELQPRSVSTHVNLGRVLAAMRVVDAAYAAFHNALRIKPDHVEAQRLAGLTALRMGQREDAERHLRAAARLAPNDPRVQQALRKLQQRTP